MSLKTAITTQRTNQFQSLDNDQISGFSSDSTAALQRRHVRAALARVEKYAPVSLLQETAIVELEEGFYKHLAHVDDEALDAASMQTICEECCNCAETQLQNVRQKEAEFYLGLPRDHEHYRKLLAFEASLESEVVAWRIILELSSLRHSGVGHRTSPVKDIQADNEHAFVSQWTRQEGVIREIQALIRVLEKSYAAVRPAELSEASFLIENPIRPRALLDRELNRLNGRSEVPGLVPKRVISDEAVFEFIFHSLRGGNERFAEETALKGGLVVFLINFKMRRYTKTVEGGEGGEGKMPHSRLRWKQIALIGLKNENMGRWERAVRGILCGSHEAALPVAESWEDEAWIYLTCFIDNAVEKAVAQWRNQQGGPGLSAETWTTSLSVSDIFDRIENSSNEAVRLSAQSVFPLSIRAAILNDLDFALLEIEKFILKTSEGGVREVEGGGSEVGGGVRFSLHVLLLMRRVGIPVEADFFSRTCYLYAQTTTSRNPELWACYLTKIPDTPLPEGPTRRYQAVSQFFFHHLSNFEDKIAFLRAISVRDDKTAVGVAKDFVRQRFLLDTPTFTPLDVEVLAGFFGAVGRETYGTAEWLLSAVNSVLRKFFLPEEMEIDEAHDFYLAVKPAVESLLEAGVASADGDSAKSEFICWARYLTICVKFSEWRICAESMRCGTMEDTGTLARTKSKEEAILAGYDILSTTDWMSTEGKSDVTTADVTIDADVMRDREEQLGHLRGKTLGQVFSSLVDILQFPDDTLDEKTEIDQLNTALDLSDHIMQNFDEKIGDYSFVEESMERIKTTADQFAINTTYSRLFTKKLKDKIFRFEQACQRVKRRLTSDETFAGMELELSQS